MKIEFIRQPWLPGLPPCGLSWGVWDARCARPDGFPTWAQSVSAHRSFCLRGHEFDGAVIRACLLPLAPPGVIFAPGRWPAMLAWLHTADHIRPASTMREPQFPPTPVHGTRIMRFAIDQ